MKFLEEQITKYGKIINDDIIKVDSFVNHQVIPSITNEVAKYFVEQFKDFKIDKIITIETSGIPIAFAVASILNIPMVFAKKSASQTVDLSNVYCEPIMSFTRNKVSNVTISKDYISEGESYLIVDDFLASGTAAIGLVKMFEKAGAKCIGVCALIEKSFQGGRAKLNDMGIKVVSGADIIDFKGGKPNFKQND